MDHQISFGKEVLQMGRNDYTFELKNFLQH